MLKSSESFKMHN